MILKRVRLNVVKMILLLLIIPIIGCLLLIPIKETEVRDLSLVVDEKVRAQNLLDQKISRREMKQIALFASLLNLLIAIIM
jgi:hypothetical protein